MMVFEDTTKSLFPSDLFIQPGNSKAVASDDLSEAMIGLYRAVGIFAGEIPVRQTIQRLLKLDPPDDFSNARFLHRPQLICAICRCADEK